MPLNTPRGYPYPVYGDLNNFPAQLQAFASAVDNDVQNIETDIAANLAAPSVRVSATANQSIPVSTDTVVTYATEEFDNDNMANLGVNNDRVVINTAGVYLISGEVNFVQNGNATTNGRRLDIMTNTNIVRARNSLRGASNLDTENSLTILWQSAGGGEVIRLQVRHNSGAAVNISARSLSVTKVA